MAAWLRAVAVAGLLLAGLVAVADARVHHPARGHRIAAGGAPPLDSFTAPQAAYSFRKLLSAYAGTAMLIRRASDAAELEIGYLGCTSFTGCPWDEASALAHCAATTCFVKAWRNQGSGGATLDITQATAGSQPQLIFGCKGSLPCFRAPSNVQQLTSAGSVTPATGVLSASVVGHRPGTSGACTFIRQNGANNRFTSVVGVASSWQIASSAASLSAAATDGVWHAANGIFHAVSGVLNIDGVETAGVSTGNTTAGATQIVGATTSVCEFGESVVWDNYQLTAGERTLLISNQRSFWGTP